MADLILTGASRGIGHALALALAEKHGDRLVLVARDRARLEALVSAVEQKGGRAIAVPGDLSSKAEARALGQRLAETVTPGATLVHNAGLWPSKRELTPEGLEAAFVVNHLAPLVMQQALLDAGRLRRIMVVSAGLILKGHFDAARTPTGADFSGIRTYCNTKLCFALAMRDVAAAHPELDVVILHPGVVRTDLGARTGPIGWLLSLVKRGWDRGVRRAPRTPPRARAVVPRWRGPLARRGGRTAVARRRPGRGHTARGAGHHRSPAHLRVSPLQMENPDLLRFTARSTGAAAWR
jgi:NAD(P)-dependent dehydrogenase (short-subunit alcohol dehydrogenase family)